MLIHLIQQLQHKGSALVYNRLLESVRPRDSDDMFNIEPFEQYKERVGRLLPNWPDCPMKNWLHRHYPSAIDYYGWLRFDSIIFELVTWNKDEIYQSVQTHKLDNVDGWGRKIYTTKGSRRSWLQKYMSEHRTWPVPIIVLDNPCGIIGPRGETLGQPYHLLEGHLRLGYFRNIYRTEPENLKSQHNIWLVTTKLK